MHLFDPLAESFGGPPAFVGDLTGFLIAECVVPQGPFGKAPSFPKIPTKPRTKRSHRSYHESTGVPAGADGVPGQENGEH
jgi:hypothetical protein